MDTLRELYQSVIIEHNRRPRNFGKIEHAQHQAEGVNPLCGDQLTVYMTIENNIIQAIKFEGTGCAISTASASLMTEALIGQSIEAAEAIFTAFHQHLTGKTTTEPEKLGKLAVLSGVREYPTRVKCATLAWHTVQAAIQKTTKIVTTE